MVFQNLLPPDAPADALMRLRLLPVPDGHWDELHDAAGAPHPAWRRFFALLGQAGAAELDQARAAVVRQVRENDISYNVYADKGAARPWALELLPFLLDAREWRTITRGVVQRAQLLNAIAADAYGSQTLLARGLVPPALVFGHPGYLRALQGHVPFAGRFLPVVACDLARSPDGQWTVLAHHAEAASGLGYALENRMIVSGLFPEPFRDMQIARIVPAYAQLAAMLAGAARASMGAGESDMPHIVLLTPGPRSEMYFEHAFLARHLGLTLVEGKDLTVRQDKLYLKTLAGLERVHGVLRRIDDACCDPVELRADSAIGVPGLLQAMRAGRVAVTNTPGAGLVESPALHGFLPALSQALLGEPLALPTVPTWWCGEEAVRAQAQQTLSHAFLLPTWPDTRGNGPPGVSGGAQDLAAWRERIESAADTFTICQPLPYSCAPRYASGALSLRPVLLRVYAFAGLDGAWHVVPGGFTRLAPGQQGAASLQFGGSSADTWVLSDGDDGKIAGPLLALAAPASLPSVAPSASPEPPVVAYGRRAASVTSRAAENLFWAGRYAERSENNVRLGRLILGSLEDDGDGVLGVLVHLAAHNGLIAPDNRFARTSRRAFEHALVAGLRAGSGVDSIGQNLASQVAACGEIRGRLSSDHWRTVLAARNDFDDALARCTNAAPDGGYERTALMGALDRLAMQLGAVSGAQGDRMMRDAAWRLLFVGRHIERVATMTMYLQTVAGQRQLTQPASFELLLQLFDSVLTYRSLYPGRYEARALLDLLVVDPSNPRGLYGVYHRLRRKLDEIPQPSTTPRTPFAQLLPPVDALPALDQLCANTGVDQHDTLMQTCTALRTHVEAISSEVSARYFSHASLAVAEQAP